MRSDARRLPQVLRSLARLRVVCVHGDDIELVGATARQVVAAAAGSTDDPFRVTVSAESPPEAIDLALSSPPLAGGRSVVWARQGGERLGALVLRTLSAGSDALLVVEFAGAGKTSKLRRAVEASDHGCALACYGSEEAARADIRAMLQEEGVSIGPDEELCLAGWAAATQRTARQAVDMLLLYAGAGPLADPAVARILAGGAGLAGPPIELGAALDRSLSGSRLGLDGAVEDALAETTAIGVGRAALAHVQRLRVIGAHQSLGRPLSEAGRSVRPPVFAREEAAVAAVLQRRTAEQLSGVAWALWLTERLCKRNGMPAEVVVRSALLRVG